ncbi:MAG: class I SAM-dependent methyltransferase [Dehalococcoidia bacterium]
MSSPHSILRIGNLLMVQERERWLSRFLARHWPERESLDGFRVFEAGCSTGYNLRLFVQWGGRPEDMAGQDIDASLTQYCAEHAPEIRVHPGSAEHVPEPDEHFDLSLAFTLLSSVPTEETAGAIARELVRVTKPGGAIVVYDMRRRSRNAATHPIMTSDIARWFAPCHVRTETITLAPPLARRLPWLYGPLAAFPPLRTHAMHVVRRPALPLPRIGA